MVEPRASLVGYPFESARATFRARTGGMPVTRKAAIVSTDSECCDPQWNEEHQAYEHSPTCERHEDPFLISEADFPFNPQLPPPAFGSKP
jgi:hypothetical protein